ncbi:hypothetical protein P7X80_11425 [Lactiplantibacillus plantarum]|nr:hypothetical protein [Lactiplantibacillus plantarum]MDQ7897253.1 hypothetical protein [Lactiplantibacillus plantarum]
MKTTTRSWLAMIVIGIFTIMANLDASMVDCKINPNAVRTKKISFL